MIVVVLMIPMVRVLAVASLGAGHCLASVWSSSWSLAGVRCGWLLVLI